MVAIQFCTSVHALLKKGKNNNKPCVRQTKFLAKKNRQKCLQIFSCDHSPSDTPKTNNHFEHLCHINNRNRRTNRRRDGQTNKSIAWRTLFDLPTQHTYLTSDNRQRKRKDGRTEKHTCVFFRFCHRRNCYHPIVHDTHMFNGKTKTRTKQKNTRTSVLSLILWPSVFVMCVSFCACAYAVSFPLL